MNSIVLRYVAKKVIEDIRNGRNLDKDLCDALCAYPEMDYLREVVHPDDADYIIDLWKSGKEPVRSLVFGLLHPLGENKKVKEFLKNLWEETTDYKIKLLLLWRLLDNSYLDVEFHRSIYSFVQDNYKEFIDEVIKFAKGDVITYAKDRLEDKRFPESKAWIYLIIAASVEENIDSLLNQYENSKASIVAEVVKHLKEKGVT